MSEFKTLDIDDLEFDKQNPKYCSVSSRLSAT